MDYAATTVQIPGGERVPFLFSSKKLVASLNNADDGTLSHFYVEAVVISSRCIFPLLLPINGNKKMMKVALVAAYLGAAVDAFGMSGQSAFLGKRVAPSSSFVPKHAANSIRMDMEQADNFEYATRFHLDQLIQENRRRPELSLTVDEAEAIHGMPWKSSIDPKVTDEELLYMPFWEWQMSFMKENLSNLRVVTCSNGDTDFSYNENILKKARVVNLCLASDEYRKIRLTYYDAGDNTQVFNAVWYPDPKYNLPVLGIDVLAFNRKKYLAIVDFQPIHESEAEHASEYESIMKPIKDKYDNLKGRMSSKFYDETKFFSQQMLFARFEDEKIIHDELFPAFKEYVAAHTQLVKGTAPDAANVDFVMSRQRAYDSYSAERDPATGLFCAMFGNEWATDFVHDFLFSMSEKPKAGAAPPVMPFLGGGAGGPPQRQAASAGPVATREAVVVRR